MVGVPGPFFGRGWQRQGQILECTLIDLPYLLAPPPVRFHAPQLVDPERRLDIHHVVLEAALDDLVVLIALVGEPFPCILAHPVQREDLEAIRGVFARREDHPPFARRDVLRDVEAETTKLSERPDVLALVGRLDSMGTIFDQQESMLLRQPAEPIHIAWTTGKVHGEARLRPLRYLSLDADGIDVERARVHV